jgi:hypothetical protein
VTRISPNPGIGIAESLTAANAPRHVVAILEALRFQNPSIERLSELDALEWQDLLAWCDGRQLTLLLPCVCGSAMPPEIHEEIAQRSERYAVRFERLKGELFDIAALFDAANLDFVLLKGMSHSPELTSDARMRAQGDLDLWLLGPTVHKAAAILRGRGYVSLGVSNSRHLSPLARPSNWRWTGDLFDPDIPISVELHYELWSEGAEYVAAPGAEAFWAGRTRRNFDGHQISVLGREDLIGFAALHLLLHVLHGDLPLQRGWEIARFLDTHSDDAQLWESWHAKHPSGLRQLEVVSYDLVRRWFGCRWPRQFDAELRDLPKSVRSWLEHYSLSPLISQWSPNKREVWLHLALIDGWSYKVRVLARRLLPISLVRFGTQPTSESSFTESLRILLEKVRLFSSRLLRHLRTFLPTIYDGLRLMVLRRL